MQDATNEPNRDPTNESTADAGESVADTAEKIAAEGADVRERVRRLVLDTAGGGVGLKTLRESASSILSGVSRAVRDAGQDESRTVLNETVQGISDGFASAAQATKLAMQEAEGRGTQFTQDEVKRTADDLRTLEKMLVDLVSDTTGKLTGEARGQAGAVLEHARRAAESMRPSIESALETATRNPGKLAGETASAGADTARGAVGSLFGVAAGFLDAAAEIVSGEKKPADTPAEPGKPEPGSANPEHGEKKSEA